MTDERSERLRQRLQRRKQRAAAVDDAAGSWTCGIVSCSYTADTVEDLITHQTHDHSPHTCRVCGRDVPEGFAAIYHIFEEHGRTEFVKAYDASPDDVRHREQVKAMIEEQVDVTALFRDTGP